MKPRSKKSKETAPHSTDGRKRRTRAGKSRRRNWKPLCAGRATSHVAMSQDARRVDPSVVSGARPAPSPGFIEPCRPALREEAPSGGRWIHEIQDDGVTGDVQADRLQLGAGRRGILGSDTERRMGVVPSA